MNILILGGTGAMGTHLCQILANGGGIFVTSRRERKAENGVTYLKGNAHEEQFLYTILKKRNWDAIVDFMIYSTDEFRQRADLLLQSTKQYVFLSSARVYADSKTPITEDSPRLLDVCKDQKYLSTDEYALTKARQEDILRQSGKHNWTIIRPYVTFSEIRLQLSPAEKESWLWGALHGKSILFSRDLAEKYTTLTYGYDVARGIAAIIGKDTACGEAFHITVSESHKWGELLDNYLNTIERKTGHRPKVKLLDRWDYLMGGGPMQVKWDRLYDRRFDNSKISKYIDTSTFKQTLPAMSECLSAFIDNPEFKPINWGCEAKKDRLTGEWTKISEITGVKQKIKYLLIRCGLYR